MLRDLYSLMLAAAALGAQDTPLPRAKIWLYFASFKFKNRIYRSLGLSRTHERLFGMTLRFTNYNSFVYLFEEIYVRGTYHFRPKSDRPVILDCGSNIGLSVLYLKQLYPNAKIVAFEAARETFALLKENIARNKVTGVELHNLALSDRTGEVSFYSDGAGSLAASVFPDRNTDSGPSDRVTCMPLSHFVSSPVDFLKMDIEGAESICLREAARAQKLDQIREMVIECHHNLPEQRVLTEVLPLLESEGFSYQVGARPRLPAHARHTQDVIVHAHREARA